ncbi:MAG: capsule assembly Wzi family protein [Bacteroidaceae bacterium]|nr:capsule assembly Wzi family protein [Bacteroidaceae bacterium]
MYKRRFSLLITSCLLCTAVNAQLSRLGEDVDYQVTASGQFGDGEHAPFWLSANRYGLASINNNSGYVRASIQRDTQADSQRNWRLGYAADLVVPFGYDSKFLVQQLYAEAAYKLVRLSIGQKERPAEMKNNELSSGSMVLGTNARPLPQIRVETSDFFAFPGTKQWIHLKGHLAYGWYADNQWQRDFNNGNNARSYTNNSLYHSKAGYLRVSNLEKFPLTFTGGVEMVCQFGGTAWNVPIKNKNGELETTHAMKGGVKEYLQAFIPTGSDVIDGDNPNVMGNNVGSYQARLDYHGKGWGASLYGEHFFEDHSMMGFDFDWKDFLWGAEIKLPSNPIISTVVLEHMRTTDQSGPVFSNKTDKTPSIGGVDDYYCHGIYGAYQHAGFVMGTPLLISPIYNENNNIYCYDNRITAQHVGVSGNPCNDLSYRILYTHEKSLGTYKVPRENPTTSDFLMAEVTYRPHKIEGLAITASYGQDWGSLTGNNQGALLTVSYSGGLTTKK